MSQLLNFMPSFRCSGGHRTSKLEGCQSVRGVATGSPVPFADDADDTDAPRRRPRASGKERFSCAKSGPWCAEVIVLGQDFVADGVEVDVSREGAAR